MAQSGALAGLADTYAQMDDFESQIQTLEQALEVNALRHGAAAGNFLDRAFWAHMRLSDYNGALDCVRRAQALNPAGPPDPELFAQFGSVYGALGDTAKALDFYRQALSLRKAPMRRANDHMSLGSLYAERQDFPAALENFQAALDFFTSYPDHSAEVRILIDMGRVQRNAGDTAAALQFLNRAAGVLSGVSDPLKPMMLANLAGAWFDAGEKLRAREAYEAALQGNLQGYGPLDNAAWYAGLARAERGLGDLVSARTHIEKALTLFETARLQIRSPDLRTSFFSHARSYYDFYVGLLMPGLAGEALQAAERGRARTLLEILAEARADIRNGVDPELLQQERKTQQHLNTRAAFLRQVQGRELSAGETGAVESEIRALKADLDRIEAQIRDRSPNYAALTQPSPLRAQEIQELLDEGTVLLEYSLAEPQSYLWVVTRDSVSAFVLPPRAEIEAATRRLYGLLTARSAHPAAETPARRRARIEHADAEWSAAAASVARMILSPAGSSIKGRRVAIVPDGALAYISFAALPDSQTGRPLSAGHDIVVLPSAAVLGQIRRQAEGRVAPPKAVALLADPVLNSDDERVGNRVTAPARSASRELDRSIADVGIGMPGGRIPRLPFSRSEARSIFALAPHGSAFLALDFDASRATGLSPELSRYRIVHLATHALLDSDTPALSGVVLSLVDRSGKPQDGFLRLNEIYNLNLPADLVVLSACQTALGKDIRGEGILGLSRGFMYAGASRVLASLWNVDDAATAGFMLRFYQALFKEHLPAAAALRKAQEWTRSQPQWRSPYYWAAFELQGDWK